MSCVFCHTTTEECYHTLGGVAGVTMGDDGAAQVGGLEVSKTPTKPASEDDSTGDRGHDPSAAPSSSVVEELVLAQQRIGQLEAQVRLLDAALVHERQTSDLVAKTALAEAGRKTAQVVMRLVTALNWALKNLRETPQAIDAKGHPLGWVPSVSIWWERDRLASLKMFIDHSRGWVGFAQPYDLLTEAEQGVLP